MEYINYVKNRAHIGTSKKTVTPVLSEEDEQFLNRITSHDEHPPPLPPRPRVQDLPVAGETRGNDAQVALMDGAQNIALPETPDEIMSEPEAMQDSFTGSNRGPKDKSSRNTWSWLRRDSRDHKRKVNDHLWTKERETDQMIASNRHRRKSHGHCTRHEIAGCKTK